MRDAVFHFINAATDAEAQAVDTSCAARMPRPLAFQPPLPARATAGRQRSEAVRRFASPRTPDDATPPGTKDVAMIAMDDLRKQFTSGRGRQARTVVAVDGMTLHAQDGAITGLLGPNGAGKTTSLRMLVGLVTPDSGTIRVDGLDLRADPQGVRARLGVLSDARGLYPRHDRAREHRLSRPPARRGQTRWRRRAASTSAACWRWRRCSIAAPTASARASA